MAKGYTLVVVEGSLGRDPELKATSGGTKVANFSVAVEDGYGDKVKTSWINIVAFDPKEKEGERAPDRYKLASFAERFLKKGKVIRVIGKLDVRSWEDKQTGQKRYATEVIASDLQFASGDSTPSSRPNTSSARQPQAPQTRQQVPTTVRADDSDPFAEESF